MALILIVDDSVTTRGAVRKVLKGTGHETIEAADGNEALKMAASQEPDCMVLDLIMPGLDGLGVLKALREKGSKIPVVVLTADIQETMREECLELGAVAFVNKPMISQEISDVITTALGHKQEVSDEPDPRSA